MSSFLRSALVNTLWAAVAALAWCSIAAAQVGPGGGGTTANPNIVYDPTVNTTLQGSILPAIQSPLPLGSDGTIGPAALPADVYLPRTSCSSNCAGTVLGPFLTDHMRSVHFNITAANSADTIYLEASSEPDCMTNPSAPWTGANGVPLFGANSAIGSTPLTNLNNTFASIHGAVVGHCMRVQMVTYNSGATYTIEGYLSPREDPLAQLASGSVVQTLGTVGWKKSFFGALSTTVQAIKTSAGVLGYVRCKNSNASESYIQVFDKTTGNVTLGSTAPDQSYAIPPTASDTPLQMSVVGIGFTTAISVAATTAYNGNTAPGTGLICNFGYN